MQLIFDNCTTFNQEGSEYFEAAVGLKAKYMDLYKKDVEREVKMRHFIFLPSQSHTHSLFH